jgi:hypothetical protein
LKKEEGRRKKEEGGGFEIGIQDPTQNGFPVEVGVLNPLMEAYR